MTIHRHWKWAFVLAVLFAAARAAGACSICRCGDPTFNALGNAIYASGALHAAIDWDRFEKSQATEEGGLVGTDHETENRVTASLSYSFAERFIPAEMIRALVSQIHTPMPLAEQEARCCRAWVEISLSVDSPPFGEKSLERR